MPSVAACSFSPSHGWIHPASANSAVQITSMPTRSTLESSAASRRTISSRCWFASVGRRWYLIV
ncbi:MAG TPA: hypothetical protein VFD31_06360 [Thermoleophilaceae bacterium]|nr:hypothetical protein [Thermoleophilaceae bacterium]